MTTDNTEIKFTQAMLRDLCDRADLSRRELAAMIAIRAGLDTNQLAQSFASFSAKSTALPSDSVYWLWYFYGHIKPLPDLEFTWQNIFDDQTGILATRGLSGPELCTLATAQLRQMGYADEITQSGLNSYQNGKTAIPKRLQVALALVAEKLPALPNKQFTWQNIFDDQTGILATRGLSMSELATLATAQLRQMGYADEITQSGLNHYQNGKNGIPKRLQVALALVAEKLPALPNKQFTWQNIFDDQTGILATRDLSGPELCTLATAQLRQMGYADEITQSGLNSYQNGKTAIPKRLQVALYRINQWLGLMEKKEFLKLLREYPEHQALSLWPKPAPALSLKNFVPLLIHGKISYQKIV